MNSPKALANLIPCVSWRKYVRAYMYQRVLLTPSFIERTILRSISSQFAKLEDLLHLCKYYINVIMHFMERYILQLFATWATK